MMAHCVFLSFNELERTSNATAKVTNQGGEMNQELQDKLYQTFPKIFAQKDLSISQSAMPFGLQCGDGWYWLIYHLCFELQSHIDSCKEAQVEASQVKEKFGRLVFCVINATPHILGMIAFAEALSYSICEL